MTMMDEGERFGEQVREVASRVAEFERFREQVREVAIRVAEEQDWCEEGLNEVLEELGLPPKEQPEYLITMRVIVKARPTSPIESPDMEQWASDSIHDVEVEMDEDWDDEHVVDWSIGMVEEA